MLFMMSSPQLWPVNFRVPVRIAALAVVLLGVSAIPATWAKESTRAPNIILVMADDLGWSDIGCYGGEIPTPAIDSLARDGLRFTQFYNNSICGPSRASLLTGLYSQQVGHRGDRWNEPKDFSKCVTVGEVLKTAGYRTMMVGKWQGRDLPADRGFDRFFGPMCQGKISYFNEVAANPYYLDRQKWTVPANFYLTDALNQYSVKFLQEAVQGEEPFFLYVAHLAPHWPLHARPEAIARHRAKYRQGGWDTLREARFARQQASGLIPKSWPISPRPYDIFNWAGERYPDWQAERMAAYAAQVESIDTGLAELLQVLEKSGKADNTLVMFLSDNGAAPDGGLKPSTSGFGFSPEGPNDRWRTDGVAIQPGSGPELLPGPANTFAAYGVAWAVLSDTPFRGTKLTGFEGGIRTPLVARWPAGILERNQLTHQVGHVMDFMATAVELAGATYPAEFQGRHPLPLEGKSLAPIFAGELRAGHAELCWSVPSHLAIRSSRWKAIRPRGEGVWQLFDLEADGCETNDLASRQPILVQSLAQRYAAWQRRVGDR